MIRIIKLVLLKRRLRKAALRYNALKDVAPCAEKSRRKAAKDLSEEIERVKKLDPESNFDALLA